MTKQVNNSKQTPHTFPENIQKELEEFWEPITSVYYCGELAIKDGGKVVRVPTFAVNNTRYVYVHDEAKGIFTYEEIARRQERQRKFGEDVRRLMDEYGFSWELGKVIIQAYPSKGIMCETLCQRLQEAKESILNNDELWGWKTQFEIEPKKAMDGVIFYYELNWWINTRKPQVYTALKNYLFAINRTLGILE